MRNHQRREKNTGKIIFFIIFQPKTYHWRISSLKPSLELAPKIFNHPTFTVVKYFLIETTPDSVMRLSFRFIEMTFYARSSSCFKVNYFLTSSALISLSLFSIIHSNIAYEMKNKSLN